MKNKKNKKIGKRGALITDETVNTIILVGSIVIIVIILGYISYRVIIQERSCHDSIVLRSSVNYGVFSTTKIVPLKCDTEKICLTASGNNCDIFGQPTKDNYISKKAIDKNDADKAKQDILKKISDDMVQCDSMLGEGKLLFMPKSFFTGKLNYCLICSRIAFDEKAKQEVGSISYSELYQYMSMQRTSAGQNYLEYLHPGWKDWRASQRLFEELQQKSTNADFKNLAFQDWKIDLNNPKGYVIVAQIVPQSYLNQISAGSLAAGGTIGILSYIGGASLISTGVGAPVGIAMLGAGAYTGSLAFSYASPDKEFDYVSPMVYPADPESLQNLNCYSFETSP